MIKFGLEREQERMIKERRSVYWSICSLRQYVRDFGPPTAKLNNGRFYINWALMGRSIATCEIDSYYLLAPISEEAACKFGRGEFGPPANERLAIYWLCQIVSYLSCDKEERYAARGIVLHTAWNQLRPLLRSLDLLPEFRFITEEKEAYTVNKTLRPLISALLLLFDMALDFFNARKESEEDAFQFFSLSHLEFDFLVFVLFVRKGQFAKVRNHLDDLIEAILTK